MNNSQPTLYEILEISKDATDKEIKRAYRALSLTCHPDKTNGDPVLTEKFKVASAAYEVLGDPAKRRNYDEQLNSPFNFTNMQGFDGHDNPFGNDEINQIFSSLFSNMGMGMGVNGMPGVHFFHSGGGGGVHSFQTHIFNQIQKPPPIVKNIAISLEECYTGCEMTVDVERWINTQNTKITKVEFININIPQGIDSGETITIQNAGHELNDEVRGDIKLIINIINDTHFKRVGNDLFFNKKISLKESLIGFSLNVQHINGKMLYLNNASETSIVIKPNHKKTIPNLGMIKNGVTGNLIIEFEIEYPNMISQEQKNALMGIL